MATGFVAEEGTLKVYADIDVNGNLINGDSEVAYGTKMINLSNINLVNLIADNGDPISGGNYTKAFSKIMDFENLMLGTFFNVTTHPNNMKISTNYEVGEINE